MSLAIAHFSVGATLTIGILLLSGLYRWWPAPAVIVFGGGLAMLPDIWRVSPVSKSFHESPLSNVFFGHYHLDIIDAGDSHEVAAALFAIFCGAMLAFVIFQRYPVWKPEQAVLPVWNRLVRNQRS